MIKKVGLFISISILLFAFFLIASNFEAILEVVNSFPKDRIICYLLGAITMFLAQVLTSNRKKKTLKANSPKE